MTAHTPGPWGIAEVPVTRGVSQLAIMAPNRKHCIAYIAINLTPQSANAEFIVRACNAHEELVAEAIELLRNATYADGLATVLTQDCEALEAAIAKATGDTP